MQASETTMVQSLTINVADGVADAGYLLINSRVRDFNNDPTYAIPFNKEGLGKIVLTGINIYSGAT